MTDIDGIIDSLCKVGERCQIHFLWRPALKDPIDDIMLELAVTSAAEAIITFTTRDFKGSEAFSIRVITPQQMLREIGEPT